MSILGNIMNLLSPSTKRSDLCGFYGIDRRSSSGYEMLGALSKSRKPSVPRGKGASGKSPHKESMVNAGNVAQTALTAGTHALSRASQYDPSKHKPIIPLAPINIHGITVFGAVRPLTAAQKAAVQKHANAIVKHAHAVTVAKNAGTKAIAAAKDLQAFQKKAAPIVNKLLSPSMKSKMHGIWGLDIPIPDPDQTAPSTNYDPNNDPNLIPLPVRDQRLSQSDANVTWQKVPEDGVAYDGSKGYPAGAFGSYNLAYGGGDGFFYGPSGWYARRLGDKKTPDRPASDEELADIAAASARYNWGPLIGLPNPPANVDPGFKSIQFATQDKKWFWQSQNAPSWATIEADSVIALNNKKIQDTDQKAADAEAARIAQEQAQQQETVAQQEAANALAQSAADSDSQIQQKKQADQQAQLALEQQKAEQDQAAAEAKAALDQQAAQAQLDIQERQQALDYAKQHPEQAQFQTPGQSQYPQYPAYSDYSNDAQNDSDDGQMPSASEEFPQGPQPDFGPGEDDPLAGVPYMQ